MATVRRYDNAGREERARETRARILATARDVLQEEGYPALSAPHLARLAGVSPQTVYTSIGTKGEVVKAVYDVVLAGDDEPIAMSDRPEFVAMAAASDRPAYLAAYATWTRRIYDRVGALLGTLLTQGAAGDAVIADFLATIEQERRTGNGHGLDAMRAKHGLPDGLSRERALDIVWTLTSPEVADRLIRRCGWTADEYEAWLAKALTASLG